MMQRPEMRGKCMQCQEFKPVSELNRVKTKDGDRWCCKACFNPEDYKQNEEKPVETNAGFIGTLINKD